MDNKFVAVQGCILVVSPGVAGSIIISTPPSDKVKIDGKGVYFGPLTVNVSGFTSEKIDAASGSGTGVIYPTATSVNGDGKKIVRLNDMSLPIQIIGKKGIVEATDTVTVTIVYSGQKKVKAA